MNKMALWTVSVCVDDWTAEWGIIASNEYFTLFTQGGSMIVYNKLHLLFFFVQSLNQLANVSELYDQLPCL